MVIRVLILHNPRSGSRESNLSSFITYLRNRGAEVTIQTLQTTNLTQIKHWDCVVAAGGDGTVSSVAYALRGTGIPLLVYPAGTANLIFQNLALPRDPIQLADLVISGCGIDIDLGELESGGQTRGFCMLAGAGADADMIRGAEYKHWLGEWAYVLSAARQLNPPKTDFILTIDGQQRLFTGIAVMVANFGMANYRIPISHSISPIDGRLTIIFLSSGWGLVPHILESVWQKIAQSETPQTGFEICHATEITIDANRPLNIQYDGELHEGTTPLQIRILPKAVRFLTCASEAEIRT